PTLSFSITLAPFAALTAIALGAWPVFLAMVWLRCLAVLPARQLAEYDAHAAPRLADHELPVYSVIVPLYREASVLAQLLAALDALDYPRAKLDIMIVTESDDEETRHAIEATRFPAHIKAMVMPPGQPRTKPRALNAALLEATGSLVTIFDAEDVPDPQQLRGAADVFALSSAKLACLQARLVVDNGGDGWLTRCFALEYAGLFDALNPGLLARGWPILLGGTSNHFRMSAVRAVGGWDAWNVTEDADLGVRLVRAGYQMADLNSATYEEAPASPGLWFRQRTRWMKGFMQTIVTHTDRPFTLMREAGSGATLVLLILSLGTVISALGYPFFLAAMLMWALGLISSDLTSLEAQALSGISIAVFCLGMVAMLVPPALGAIRRQSFDLLAALPLLPLYYGLVSLAAWRALFDCVFAPFHWNKTQHGLARTSRRRDQLTGASATLERPGPVGAPD
ncbi:MAG: glycosyltransferase, partial [Bosea sp. (in: a-proteobacteria)]